MEEKPDPRAAGLSKIMLTVISPIANILRFFRGRLFFFPHMC
jgi:hypothetical protein|nr:hypothetical protein [Pseudoflavonifractor sp. BIOML-A9]